MTNVEPIPDRPWELRRRAFVNALYRLQDNVERGGYAEPDARRQLALLRRSFAGARQEANAYDFVFRHDPPEAEQEIWLLLAGLFALYPQRRRANDSRSFGATMGELALAKNSSSAVERRFVQLLSARTDALPHYLRQCVQLARGRDAPINYERLLQDLIGLTGPDQERAHQTRLRWARDYHRRIRSQSPRLAAEDTTAHATDLAQP
jgi:CRISPR system Cascade subunit CasB